VPQPLGKHAGPQVTKSVQFGKKNCTLSVGVNVLYGNSIKLLHLHCIVLKCHDSQYYHDDAFWLACTLPTNVTCYWCCTQFMQQHVIT